MNVPWVVVPDRRTLLHARQIFIGGFDQFLEVIAFLLVLGLAFWGMFLATYTGVLLGATAIPAWFLHRTLLPIHFGVAGLGSAAALLELLGHRIAPLGALGFLAAGVETLLWVWLEIDKHGKADRALRESRSAAASQTAEVDAPATAAPESRARCANKH